MTEELTRKENYVESFNKIIEMIESRKERAYRKVNEELISLYWDIGCYVSEKISLNE